MQFITQFEKESTMRIKTSHDEIEYLKDLNKQMISLLMESFWDTSKGKKAKTKLQNLIKKFERGYK